jgi:hypothetical protein
MELGGADSVNVGCLSFDGMCSSVFCILFLSSIEDRKYIIS